jgi:hypothetical protein
MSIVRLLIIYREKPVCPITSCDDGCNICYCPLCAGMRGEVNPNYCNEFIERHPGLSREGKCCIYCIHALYCKHICKFIADKEV